MDEIEKAAKGEEGEGAREKEVKSRPRIMPFKRRTGAQKTSYHECTNAGVRIQGR